MALYEYRCKECQHAFERIQKFGARAPRCPECSGRTERLISAPAIHFKGSGWYVTDYARKGKGKAGEGSKTSSDTASSSKGADKPAAKPAKGGGGKKS
jgi:putative FmdB family regulatory protein